MAPQNPGNVNVNSMMLDAMTSLTRQLQRNLEYYEKSQEQQTAQPPIAGVDPRVSPYQTGLFNPDLATTSPTPRSGPSGQGQLFNPGAYPEATGGPMAPGDTYLRYPPNETTGGLRSNAQRALGTFRESGARQALGQWSGRIPSPDQPDGWASGGDLPGQGDPGNSLPPNLASGAGGMGGGPGMGGMGGLGGMGGGSPFNQGGVSDQSMFTWAMLGEHGGPQWMRDIAFGAWGAKRSLDYAQNSVLQPLLNSVNEGNMPDWMSGSMASGSLQTVSDLVGIAAQHPLAAYGAYRVGSAAVSGVHNLLETGQNWQNIGAQLGVPVTPDRYIMGVQNPLAPFLSGSTSVGSGAAINRRQLMGQLPGGMGMGSGLSGTEASETINAIVGQGFGGNENALGGGDIGAISNQFMGPLLQQLPGLSPSDLAQFLPLLRNSGTSLTQLTNSLSDLGTAAQATHETVGQAASSLMSYAESTKGMGSAQGALSTGQTFRNITGMDPQILGQMLQNPLTQGMALSRYGVLPSGINDMNPAATTSLSTQSLDMLMRATSGLNRNIYGTVDGRRTLIETGSDRQVDQVAQMMGIQPNEVRRLMAQQQGNTARGNIMSALTGPGGFEAMTRGGAGTESKAEISTAQQYWMKNIAPYWKGTGIGQKEMGRLSNEGFQKRIRDMQSDMNRAQSKTPWSTTQSTPSAQTVRVGFTGAAAKFFQQVGPTTAKQAANAGQFSISSVYNSITGDIGSLGSDIGNVASGAANDFASGIESIGHLF